jgi:hypothetical protein
MVKDLDWGISPPTERVIAGGARAIYKCPDGIDLVWDRMGMQGGTEEQRKQFGTWLDKKGIPALKEQLRKEYLSSSDDKYINIHLDGWFITANPRGSCGYLYIGAFPCDNGDPNYMPEAVDLTPVPKKRATRRK